MTLLQKLSTRQPTVILLGLLLLLGAGLRCSGLARDALWTDELESWRKAQYTSVVAMIQDGIHTDIHPPAYWTLLYLVEHTLGDSETALRLPSALAGVLSIAAIFCLGRRLYADTEGLIAAALLTVLWAPLYYSQEARPYSILLCGACVATYFWVEIGAALHKSSRPAALALWGYGLTAVCLAYLHYFGLYLIFLQGVGAGVFFLLARNGRAFFTVFKLYGLILLAYAPWLPALWEHLQWGTIWISAPGDLSNSFGDYLNFLFNKSEALRNLALAFGAWLLLHSLYRFFKTKAYRRLPAALLSPGLFLLLWLTLPFLGVYLKSKFSTPVLTLRNLIISLPAAYLLLARAIAQLPWRPKLPALVACALVGTSLYQVVFALQYYSAPQKGQLREAVAYIVQHDAQYPGALVIGYSWQRDYFDYYFKNLGASRRVDAWGGLGQDVAGLAQTLQNTKPRYLWYITAFRSPETAFLDFLHRDFVEKDHQAFPGPAGQSWLGSEVWLFAAKSP